MAIPVNVSMTGPYLEISVGGLNSSKLREYNNILAEFNPPNLSLVNWLMNR
jgi:hypothetical protein